MRCLDEIYRYLKELGSIDKDTVYSKERVCLRIHGQQVVLDYFAPMQFLSLPSTTRGKLIEKLKSLRGLHPSVELDRDQIFVFIAKDNDVYGFYLEDRDEYHRFVYLFYPDDNTSVNTSTGKLVKIKKIRRKNGL